MKPANDFAAFAALDLGPIKMKLMHEQSGEGWSQDRADAVEFEYRRFLYLMKQFPFEQTSPTIDVDTFWHYHILDTIKYANDCDQVFGYFLHHYPYIGMLGKADDVNVHQRSGERMRELYEDTFGEPYPGASAYCGVSVADPAYCGAAEARTGYCGATTAKPAYCGVAADKQAYCGVAAKPAYCGVATNKNAYCGVAAKSAYCGVAAGKHAYCGAVAKPAYCGAAVDNHAYCGSTAAPERV